MKFLWAQNKLLTIDDVKNKIKIPRKVRLSTDIYKEKICAKTKDRNFQIQLYSHILRMILIYGHSLHQEILFLSEKIQNQKNYEIYST